MKPVDLGGEIGLDVPAGWTCRWLGPGRWWCGEDEEHGLGVFLRQDLTDPQPSEPGRPPTPLANAAYRAGEVRAQLERWRPDPPVSDVETLSGRLLHCGRELAWEGHRARQLHWFAIDGYSAASSVFQVILNVPVEMLGDPGIEPLIAHFAGQAAAGNRCLPETDGTLRLRDLRIGDEFVVSVPAEWRCEGDGESVCCRFGDEQLALIVVTHDWERSELLARIDPAPPADGPASALTEAVAAHFSSNMPAGFEVGPVAPAPHGAIYTARETGQGGAELGTADKLYWIYVVMGEARVTCIWFSLILPPDGLDDPDLPAHLDRIGASVRRLRPAGAD
jgi:hypothetical protein